MQRQTHLPRASTWIASALALFVAVPAAAIPVFAQEKTQEKTEPQTTKAGPPTVAMVLKTADVAVGTSFLGAFDHEGDLPDLGADEHFVVTLQSDGKATAKTATGKVGWYALTIHPMPLMELYADTIDEQWDTISGGAIVAMTQVGMTTKDAAKLMKSVRQFPEQIDTVDVGLSTNPQPYLRGLQVSVKVVPRKDTWIAGLAKQLRPHAQGAPQLSVADPLMTMAMAIDAEGLQEAFKPFLETFAGIGAKNKKQRERNLGLYTKMLAHQDGSYFMAGNPFGGSMQSIAGVRDGKGLGQLMRSEEYKEFFAIFEDLPFGMEFEFEPNAFEHRGATVSKTVVTTEIDTPTMPAGDQITYGAVAGDYLVSTVAGKPEDVNKLIDMAMDQNIKRAPVAGSALLTIRFKFMELLDKTIPFGNPFAGKEDSTPKYIDLALDNKLGSFNLTVEFK